MCVSRGRQHVLCDLSCSLPVSSFCLIVDYLQFSSAYICKVTGISFWVRFSLPPSVRASLRAYIVFEDVDKYPIYQNDFINSEIMTYLYKMVVRVSSPKLTLWTLATILMNRGEVEL